MSKHRHRNNNPHNVLRDDVGIPTVEPQDAAEGVSIDNDTAAAEGIEYDGVLEEIAVIEQPKEKQRVTLSSEVEEEPPELIVELSKIYNFDDEEIDKVDLSGLDSLSQKNQDKVDKIYRKITKSVSSTPELTPDYGVAMTHVLTGIPLEIVKQFAFKDKIRIKNAIMRFLYGDE